MRAPRPIETSRSSRRVKVAHIRYSPAEFTAVKDAADRAGCSVSGFLRLLSLEGAGVDPFLSVADGAIFRLLSDDISTMSSDLNSVARAINAGLRPNVGDLARLVMDAQAAVITVAAELATMLKRQAARRRGQGM